MAEIQPFRGWRYELGQVGSLSEVTAPPYDVIDADRQKELYEKHPCNVVRLILNREEPGDSPDARYQRAADFLRHWQSEGILVQEREEAIYVYHQEYDWEGTHHVRKGFLARLRLEEFGEGKVFPHEQTMPGPKADRLALTKACRTNLSPIFGLYPDTETQVQNPLDEVIRGITAVEATDHLGVIHRLWSVTDRAAINQVRDLLKEKPIFIADGHHRYETALNFRNWSKSEGLLTDDASPANFLLMHFVGMSDPGLAILPTFRLVSGLPALTSADITEAVGDHFDLQSIGTGAQAAQKIWQMIDADGGQDVFGFGTAADNQWLFARLKDASPMKSLAPEQSAAWQQLGVSILHKMVLEHLVQQRYSEATLECHYVRLMDELTSAVDEKSCQLACLVAPAGMDHVEQIASKFEKMPPKSTYFYPKLLTGLVFNPLE